MSSTTRKSYIPATLVENKVTEMSDEASILGPKWAPKWEALK